MTKKEVGAIRFGDEVEDHLADHGLSIDEVLAVAFSAPRFFRDKVDGRLRMIGRSGEGRLLTIIVRPDEDDKGTYDVITGWDASKAERSAWERDK